AVTLEANGVWTPGVSLPVFPKPQLGDEQPLLEARNLTVRPVPQARPVVTDIDLAIHSGERIAIMGDNGTGKTTLLMALSGLLETEGDITGNQPVMVFQNPEHQFLTHSAHDELRFGLQLDTTTETSVEELTEAFEL